ncbi:uncharacterized protein LOC127564370 isoform X1 [Antechinus flavipes]|uniref:uncharacterized protein LOC127564370 isoform X1 n=1 Tax=Antechinus flavipes TaxID=38775 RepID=UPI0022361521|nr:uncharacterized protein LOC127564370 isoform X1 [Antechinus flavipes]
MSREIQILEILQELKNEEFETFKKIVCQQEAEASTWSLPTTPREDIAHHLVRFCGSRALNVVSQTLDRVPARHLLEMLGEPKLEDSTGKQKTGISSHTRKEPPKGLAEQLVTQKMLMKLAQHVGSEWKELGIMCLDLQQHQLDRLDEDHSKTTTSTRIFNMFLLWRNREKEKATVLSLYNLLSKSISISPEALAVLLEGM